MTKATALDVKAFFDVKYVLQGSFRISYTTNTDLPAFTMDDSPDEAQDRKGPEISARFEAIVKHCLALGLRVIVATLVLLGMFDFLFGSIYLHGYVWSLNHEYKRRDLLSESGGYLQIYHDSLCSPTMKALFYALTALSLYFLLR